MRAFGRRDPWLLLAVLALAALGVLMVYSASFDGGEQLWLAGPGLRQLVVACVGVVAMFALATLDYRTLRHLGPPAYAGAVALLLVVLVVGSSEFGAQRWIALGAATFQPAEAAKLALALALAAYMSSRPPRALAVLASLGMLGVPLLLVLREPDAGTAFVLMGIWLSVAVAWGIGWRLLGGMLATALAFGPLMFALLVPGYQRERIAVFFDPGRDPLGSGFNLRQAELALGSGGLTGRGLFTDAGSALDGVAARSSDFAFAHVGEALGMLGGLLLLGLLALVIWRGLQAARLAPDAFGRLLAVGLTMTIFVQAFVHFAVNLRLLPATGIPLPFISQGGSSLLAMLIAAGVLQSIAAQRPASPREQWRGERWR